MVPDWNEIGGRERSGVGNDDLIRIGVDHEIRVVRDHDHLTMDLRLDEEVDQLVDNRLGIEVLLELVDHQRPVIAVIQG